MDSDTDTNIITDQHGNGWLVVHTIVDGKHHSELIRYHAADRNKYADEYNYANTKRHKHANKHSAGNGDSADKRGKRA